MTTPLVSVITRTKDRPILLPRALQSVLNQTFQNWEMIVVNDGGDPEPVNTIAQEYVDYSADRIRVLHSESSAGMEAASNKGIANTTGKYIVIHDDDDSWNPTFLLECVRHLKDENSAIAGVVTHSDKIREIVDKDSVKIIGREPFNPWLNEISISEMAKGNLFPPISFVFRRSVLDIIGGYREDLPVLGDWEFNLRFLCRYGINVIKKKLANYHIRQNLMDGLYSNTVVGGVDLHACYVSRIRDELLRRDLESGKFGLGFFMNIIYDISRNLSEGPMQSINDTQNRLLTEMAVNLRRRGVQQVVVYGAGEIGNRFEQVATSMGLRISQFVDTNPRLNGAKINGIEISSLAEAAKNGTSRYVIASFSFADEITKTIRKYYSQNGLGNPEIYEPLTC